MKRILVLSAEPKIIQQVQKTLNADYQVEIADYIPKAYNQHKDSSFSLIFADLTLLQGSTSKNDFQKTISPFKKINPMVKFIVLVSQKSLPEAIKAVKEGAYDYLTYPLDEKEIKLVVESVQKNISMNLELGYLRDHFWKTEWLDIVQLNNPDMNNVFQTIKSVAPTIATVLLLGETGSGKGVLARLIHRHSLRSENPFIAVHCGAMPDTLIESELFGHEKGSFTGAVRKKTGKFEMAQGGTIFLDEIGTISATAQIKLLQVLHDGTFCRVGGEDFYQTNARVIAATNADLKELVRQGRFRRDLFYRLNVFPVEIPPLRKRPEDIAYLADNFLKKLNSQYGKGIYKIHPIVIESFKVYDWPGNIRELENVLERSYILETTDTLTPQNLPSDILKIDMFPQGQSKNEELSLTEARHRAIGEFERSYIKDILTKSRGRINKAAERAKITPRQLSRLMAHHGIEKKEYKSK